MTRPVGAGAVRPHTWRQIALENARLLQQAIGTLASLEQSRRADQAEIQNLHAAINEAQGMIIAAQLDMREAHHEAQRLQVNERALLAELDRERAIWPAEGVWLVEQLGSGKSSVRIAKLGELPEPVAFAALARHRDAIAAAVVKCWNDYQERGQQAPIEVADAILRAVHENHQWLS